MHPKLKTLKIEKLFGHKDIELHFNDVTVLVGKNGLGKTTLLKILHALLLQENCLEIEGCLFAELIFTDNHKISFKNKIPPKSLNRIFTAPGGGKLSKDASALLEALIIAEKKGSFEEVTDNIKKADQNKALSVLNELYSFIHDSFNSDPEILNFLKNSSKIDFISTINMSANSQQVLTGSDGRQGNLLDWEIEKEITGLIKTSKGTHTLAFIKEVNRHFADSDKEVQIEEGLKVITPDSKTPLPVSKLSSGERQLLYIMAKVANTKNSPAFLLMDEPEISLHLNWQEKLLDSIKTLNPNCQIVVVTHSPAIIMDGYMDSYIDMENIVVESRNV